MANIVFDLLTQPRTEENLKLLTDHYLNLMSSGETAEAAMVAKIFNLDVEKLAVPVPTPTTTIASDTAPDDGENETQAVAVEVAAPPTEKPSFKDELRALFANINEDIPSYQPVCELWKWNYPPSFEDLVAEKPGVEFAELRTLYLPEIVTHLQEAGYYIEFAGKLAKEQDYGYQLVRIERAKTLGEWLKSSGGPSHFANKTKWKNEQAETVLVLGFYRLTTRMIVRRVSPNAKDNGAYYFLAFTKTGSGTKAKEVVEVDGNGDFQFGKLNPYQHLDAERYRKPGDDETWRRISQLTDQLELEAIQVTRQRRDWFYHLYREARRRRHSELYG